MRKISGATASRNSTDTASREKKKDSSMEALYLYHIWNLVLLTTTPRNCGITHAKLRQSVTVAVVVAVIDVSL